MSGYRSDNKAISNWRTYNKNKKENKTGKGILNMVKFYNNMNYGKKVMGQASKGADIAQYFSQSPEAYGAMDPTLQAIYSPERLQAMSKVPIDTAGGNSFNSFLDMAKQSYFPNQDITALSELGNYGKTLGVNPPIGSSVMQSPVTVTAPASTTAVAPSAGAGLATGATTAPSASTAMANSATGVAGSAGTANAVAGAEGASMMAGGSASGGLASSALANPYTAIAMALLGIGVGAGKQGSTLQRWFNPNGGVK